MEYRSVSNLSDLVRANIHRFTGHYDLVVGVPRSGVVPAGLLALHMNVPLTDIDGLLAKRVFGGGARASRFGALDFSSPDLRVLIVDDSYSSGKQLMKTKELVEAANLPFSVTYCSIFMSKHAVSSSSLVLPDIYLELTEHVRVFEWNVLHHPDHLAKACVDIDGVLCVDPTDEENDYGTNYDAFLENAVPRFLPRGEIAWLVTNRLEKYRAQTEDWLARHGVRYRELVMCPANSREERVGENSIQQFKGLFYKKNSKASLFIESDIGQSHSIATLAHKPVFCVDHFEMIMPNSPQAKLHNLSKNSKLMGRIKWNIRKVKKRMGLEG